MNSRDKQDGIFIAIIVLIFVVIVVPVLFMGGSKRTKISNEASYAQVVQNFGGKPYSTGQFVTGYKCAGYTAGKGGHGWVVIRCQK